MGLIDKSYFQGSRKVSGLDKDYVFEPFELHMEEYEQKFLKDVMGYDMYKVFSEQTADYDADSSTSTVPSRWVAIIEGTEYTKNERTRKLEPLTEAIADYVYYFWMAYNQTQTLGAGEQKAVQENATEANPSDKMIAAWNKMSENLTELYLYLRENKDTYPEWRTSDEWWFHRQFRKNNHWGI